MANQERQALLHAINSITELEKDRDDLLIGVTAVLLDIYRVLFNSAVDVKQDAMTRLHVQHQQLAEAIPPRDCQSLTWLIESLEEDKLDAARLLRMPIAGSA
jgi:hypothetical protein